MRCDLHTIIPNDPPFNMTMYLERPYKVWSCDREKRKSVIAGGLEDVKSKGAEKLGYKDTYTGELRLVLESDGTEVEDDEYFQTALKDTVFLLLKNGERWLPPGVEALKAAITAFPGNVTVVLHWDNRIGGSGNGDKWRLELVSRSEQISAQKPMQSSTSPSNGVSRANIIFDDLRSKTTLPSVGHTIKYDYDDDYAGQFKEKESSPQHDHSQCDFHCAALHRGHRDIQIRKSVTTSPVDSALLTPIITGKKATGPIKGHVRFMDTDNNNDINSVDSETETTEREDEQLCERYLLLVDQLSVEQDRHLSIKDVGIILDRLSSKIVDVEKLEREKESSDCYNWVIKATIRGEVLREIGFIYNGQYYGIMEHPNRPIERVDGSGYF